MKRFGIILAAVAILAWGLGPSGAWAEHRAGALTLSPLVGGHVFEGDQDLEDDWTYGLGFGYNYSEAWGTELLLHYTDSERFASGQNPDVDAYVLMLNGLYHFSSDLPFLGFLPEPIVPYLTAGVGGVTIDPNVGSSRTSFLINYGLGFKYFFLPDIALRGDIRHFMAFNEGLEEWNATDNNMLYSAGLTFQFGGAERAPEARPAQAEARPAPAAAPPKVQDSDNDGVPDAQDQCPNTARGVMVDEKGCPLSLNIYVEFDFDEAVIKPRYHDELKKAASFIQDHPAPYILIAGYTDSIGDEQYNQELSERRAAAVRDFLIENYKLEAEKLIARGYGEQRPVASNETPEGRALNRRTEIVCCVLIPE